MSSTSPGETCHLIRNLRQQLHLSQEKFALRLGVSFKTVNRWENGHTTPSPMALKLLAELAQELDQPDSALLQPHYLDKETKQGKPGL